MRRIGQFLPDRPVTGLDIGCGTGRYTRLLRALLPEGSLLVAADVSAAMLAQLKAGDCGHAGGVVPLLAAAEQLPLRTASLDEHLLVVAGRSRNQVEPDGPGSGASQAIKDQALQISAGRAGQAPRGVLAAARRVGCTARSHIPFGVVWAFS